MRVPTLDGALGGCEIDEPLKRMLGFEAV